MSGSRRFQRAGRGTEMPERSPRSRTDPPRRFAAAGGWRPAALDVVVRCGTGWSSGPPAARLVRVRRSGPTSAALGDPIGWQRWCRSFLRSPSYRLRGGALADPGSPGSPANRPPAAVLHIRPAAVAGRSRRGGGGRAGPCRARQVRVTCRELTLTAAAVQRAAGELALRRACRSGSSVTAAPARLLVVPTAGHVRAVEPRLRSRPTDHRQWQPHAGACPDDRGDPGGGRARAGRRRSASPISRRGRVSAANLGE